MKTVLIIDKEEETFESLMFFLTDILEKDSKDSKDSIVFLNKRALKIPQINELIKEDHPDIILIGHILRGIFKGCTECKLMHGLDVKFTKCPSCHLDGREVLRQLSPLPEEIKVISISSFAINSNELIFEYRKIGVNHFSGRDCRKIISCIFDKCDCKKL